MGFLDTIGGVVNSLSGKSAEFLEDVKKHEEYYHRLPDLRLKQEVKRLSSLNNAQKVALKRVLQERGYGSDD